MPVYMIISIEEISDLEHYKQYIQKVSSIVSSYGGQYVVRGGKITPFAGGWAPKRIIIIRFDSLEKAQQCFNSPEYTQIAPLRENSTVTHAIFVEELPNTSKDEDDLEDDTLSFYEFYNFFNFTG